MKILSNTQQGEKFPSRLVRAEAGNWQTARVAAGFSTIAVHCGQPDAGSREVTGPANGEWPL